ncbi:hypothetical protein [uncultured Microbacterium sp.]|uniref:hypothetical protein n=1 Tax=uncultured Microbacterium sp. TaxID=191216 RepID=UPI0028D0A53A|nr:hypothetical protein [uncultured Microbacterium sp.]
MSNSYDTSGPRGSNATSPESSGTVDAAAHEAADLTNTAAEQAKDVLGTAAHEAASVAGEAKAQAKDLFAQTQREFSEQARTQQQRVAEGLRSISDELGSMSSSSSGTGIAADLVHQVSSRLSAASTWLGDRDPAAVLAEVKRFARRKPGTFILAAAVVGVVAGRLTRALASSASDEKSATPALATTVPAPAPVEVHPDPAVPVPVGSTAGAPASTPLYAQTASGRQDVLGEADHDRSDTV